MMEIGTIVASISCIASAGCFAVMYWKMKNLEIKLEEKNKTENNSVKELHSMSSELNGSMQTSFKNLGDILGNAQENSGRQLSNQLSVIDRALNEKLESVNRSVGEMKAVADSVGDIKKMLSGVKTRGIMGETQLGAILENILAPSQYDREVPTIPGSKDRVEFAVRLPSPTDEVMYLPIDSKFPGDTFTNLQTAYENGDSTDIAECKKLLETIIKKSAKDIRDKYLQPPYTTNFGIMFLPFEGLYAEVVNSGLLEQLHNEYHITVAGPSTIAAMLNSLQMCFSAFAIQKNSGEVLKTLSIVKTEFESYYEVLGKLQKHLQQADKDLETLMGVRTKKINKALANVHGIDSIE